MTVETWSPARFVLVSAYVAVCAILVALAPGLAFFVLFAVTILVAMSVVLKWKVLSPGVNMVAGAASAGMLLIAALVVFRYRGSIEKAKLSRRDAEAQSDSLKVELDSLKRSDAYAWVQAMRSLDKGLVEQSAKELNALVAGHPESPLMPSAKVKLAELHARLAETDKQQLEAENRKRREEAEVQQKTTRELARGAEARKEYASYMLGQFSEDGLGDAFSAKVWTSGEHSEFLHIQHMLVNATYVQYFTDGEIGDQIRARGFRGIYYSDGGSYTAFVPLGARQ